MIPREELRVGSITMQGIVDCINENTIEVLDDNVRRFVDKNIIEPLPLSNELLKDFGFSLDICSGVWHGKRHASGWYFTLWDSYADVPYRFTVSNKVHIDLNYAHELQNLYFPIMGELLEKQSLTE